MPISESFQLTPSSLRRLVATTSLFACSLLLVGCPPGPNKRDGGAPCVGESCGDATSKACSGPEDCPVGERCIRGSCQRLDGCDNDSDCGSEQVCIEGACYRQNPDTGIPDTGGTDAEAGDVATDADVDFGDVADCKGCILKSDAGSGQCVPGTEKGACGSGGSLCNVCDDGETCQNGTCVEKSCSASSCPQGCCKNGDCKTGNSDDACGSGGESCSKCTGNSTCKNGTCTIVCGSSTCGGCCDSSGKCQPGTSDSTCGTNGASCSNCGMNQKCSNGKCVQVSCSSMCTGGCCDGSSCENGTTDALCGDNGDSCQTCGQGFKCVSQSCELQGSSRWDVIGVSATVPKTDQYGAYWDSSGNKPDVFLEITNEGVTTKKSEKTSTKDGDLTPFWYETTVSDARASDLKRTGKTTFKLVDEDPWYDPNGDDTIVECKVKIEDRLFDQQIYVVTCTDGQGSNQVKADIKFQLRPH